MRLCILSSGVTCDARKPSNRMHVLEARRFSKSAQEKLPWRGRHQPVSLLTPRCGVPTTHAACSNIISTMISLLQHQRSSTLEVCACCASSIGLLKHVEPNTVVHHGDPRHHTRNKQQQGVSERASPLGVVNAAGVGVVAADA